LGAGAVTLTVGALLSTVTETAVLVVVLPAASRATAVSVWLPFDTEVVFQLIENGAVVSSAPRFTPSSLNCTPVTPTLSVAVELTVTVEPPTNEPLAGAVTLTVGAVLSTVTETAVLVVVLPAASCATAVSVWLPFDTEVVFHEVVYGETVSSVPKFAPSSLNCTPTTPLLSEAVALTVTAEPPTDAPAAGEPMLIVGAITSTVYVPPSCSAKRPQDILIGRCAN